jgi:hypothetical protein
MVVNACNSATASSLDGKALSHLAADLVMNGLATVIGMQMPITDQAALLFSSTLYRLLAQGRGLDASVAEARVAMYTCCPSSLEWCAPVVFDRFPHSPTQGNLTDQTPSNEQVSETEINADEIEGRNLTWVNVDGDSPVISADRARMSIRAKRIKIEEKGTFINRRGQ